MLFALENGLENFQLALKSNLDISFRTYQASDKQRDPQIPSQRGRDGDGGTSLSAGQSGPCLM